MTLARALQVAAGNSQESADVAEAIDFDGTNDYLRRASDLTGNNLSKTFTFSAWIWQASSATGWVYVVSTGVNQRFTVRVVTGSLEIVGTANTNSEVLRVTCPLEAASRTATFYHVLISIDMANVANRSVYINDIAQSLTVTTYTNALIPFNQVDHVIAGTQGGSAGDAGRLSNVFLDYTYRDLSITANRRLFVTADLKPAAGQAALNPILYLPMSDPTAPGLNAGTGGNFTLTGTVARSGRGPNQYNAPYSDLDGSADYLRRTSDPTGVADSAVFTFAFSFNLDTTASATYPLQNANGYITIWLDSGGFLKIRGTNSSATSILSFDSSSAVFVAGRNYQVTISIDLSSTAKRHIYVNGVSVSGTWTTYTNQNIDLTRGNWTVGASGAVTPSAFLNGKLGALWFTTSYIDLSVAANLAKFVTGTGIDAKPVDLGANGELPTGTSPLIYLPMYGNNAGKNYGTGGDFTVNSGPYTGARGPNEYWGNLADFDGTTGYLSRTTALGLSDGKTFSMSFWYTPDSSSAANYIYYTDTSGGSARIYVLRDASNNLSIVAKNSAGTNVLNATVTTGVFSSNATAKCIQICIDLTSTSLRKIYVDGVNQTSITWTTYTNDNINWNVQNTRISTASNGLNGKLSEFYFTTDYIDFSQEASRLKFRDAFGNPVNLTQQIEDAAIPNPAIYMRFPPTSFGTNSGTGGNFTVNGTITDGGQL